MTTRPLTADELAALDSYVAEHGRKWKSALELDWYNARAIGERGAILHGMRNDWRLGSEWLRSYKHPR
jgi:hypothetical protein